MANSAYMRRDQAMRVIEEFTGRLSECTFAQKGAMFTMPAEDGEELRRALDTILLFADDRILLGENVRRAIRDPLSETAYKLMRKLQYLANKERFPRTISVPNSMLIAMVGCSKDSLIRARNELIQHELIRYKGQKRVTPQYELMYFSERRETEKSIPATYSATYPATYTTTYPATYPATIYINKTKEKSGEEEPNATNRGRACAPEMISMLRSPEDERHLRGIMAFLEQLRTTPYAELFSHAGPMQQILHSGRFPMDLVGAALEATLDRHRRYPLMDGASYALQLLVDWTSRGITTAGELRESRDNFY